MHYLHMLHEKEPGLFGLISEIVWEISVSLNDLRVGNPQTLLN